MAAEANAEGPSLPGPVEEPSASPELTPEPSPDPTADPTAEPTSHPTAEPTADPSPDPTAERTADPSPDPTADPTAEPTSDPTAAPTAKSTASPTAAPTAKPTPTPTAASPAPAAAGSPWSVAFGSRPESPAINLRNCSDVVIKDKTFRDLGAGVIAIRIENCQRVTIQAVDFINVAQAIYVLGSTDITVRDSRYSNILGPHERNGSNRGNFVQLQGVRGALIDHNKGKGGDTEDIVSIFMSSSVVVEDNHFEGTDWSSTSGSGIALSDEGGSNNVARRNILYSPGAVGIFIAGGMNNQIVDNILYGPQDPKSNVGIYVWNQSGSGCSGNTVSGNQVNWIGATGAANAFWDGGNCGVNWSANDGAAPLDPASLRVRL